MVSTNIISSIELVSFILGLFLLANNSSQNVIVSSWWILNSYSILDVSS